MTCRDAILQVFLEHPGILSTQDVIAYINEKYPDRPWKESSIRAELIGLSINHPSSFHYPSTRRQAFLFSLGRGRFRKYDPENDGTWIVDKNGARIVDDDENEAAYDGNSIIQEEEEVISIPLTLERDLETWLHAHLEQLEPGLRLYNDFTKDGRQMQAGQAGRIDLLAVDKQEKIVVVEVKAGRADDKICGQILRYMGWAQGEIAGGHDVRGIIVANDFDDRLRLAIKVLPHVILKKYSVRFEFLDA